MSDTTPPDGPDATPEPNAPRAHLQPVDGEGNAPPVLTPRHREDLEASGLDAKTIDACGMYSETSSAPIAAALGWGWRNGGGLVIPFVDYDSRAVVLKRVKPDKPRVRTKGGKRKPVKYEHPPGVSPAPYFGPATINEQRLASATRIVWTEGEKKTLALDQLGFAAVGLTGVHNFNDAEKYKAGDGLCWAAALVKYAARFIAGKDHTICYDSDAATNDHVMLAARRLAGLLLDGGARSVSFVQIPGGDEKLGVDDYFVAFGADKTRAVIAAAVPVAIGEEISPIAPRDPLVKLDSLAWLRGAKLGGDLRLPPRYEVRRDRSVWVEPMADNPQADFKEVTRAVVLPVRLLKEHGGAEERVELAWFVRGRWEREVVDRRSLRDTRRVLADLPPSVAITSNNAAAMVGFFDDYMRHNEDRLRCVHYVTRGGWQETESGRAFMLDKPITKGVDADLVPDESGDRADILAALKPRGTLDAHTEVLREVFAADSTAAIAILAALSAPLLKVLGAPNYSVNLYGDSSTGKTSIMKCAASTFGDPTNPQWVASWLATPAAIEVRAETLCDLPIPFDEAGSGDALTIEKTVYMLNNGVGKARSNRALGVRETPRWRTVGMSTGERELVDRHAATGAQIRLLQFRVSCFGGVERGAAWVDDVRTRCEANHGNVGRRWIEAIVESDDWTEVQKQYDDAKAWFREQASGQLMQRQAVYFALLWVVECLAFHALGIGDERGATVTAFFQTNEDVQDEIESAADRALESVSQWVGSNADAFPGLSPDANGRLITRAKTFGRAIAGVRHKRRVYVLTSALRERFDREGLSYGEAVRAWRAAGLTECDGKRCDTRLKFNGDRVRVVALSCDALGMDPHVEGDDDAEDFRE